MGPEAGAAGGEGVHPVGDLWPLLEGDVVPRVAAVVRLDERHAAVDGVAERDAVLPVGPEVHGVVEDALRVVAVRLEGKKGYVYRGPGGSRLTLWCEILLIHQAYFDSFLFCTSQNNKIKSAFL